MNERLDRWLLVITLGLALTALLLAFGFDHVRWLATAGLLCEIAGILQLKASDYFGGLLDRHLERDAASTNFAKWGSEGADQPIQARLRNQLFLDGQTGFALIIFGSVLQLIATWLPN